MKEKYISKKFDLPSEKYLFKKKQIPQIIDEKYLQQTEIDSSPLYYQLQFIFDELDKQGFYQYLIESYLICTRKINQMKVPKYCSTIANDMIPKYISFAGHKKEIMKMKIMIMIIKCHLMKVNMIKKN